MHSTAALAVLLQERLSTALRDAVRHAAALATARGLPLYLVGGTVRDLLLGRPHRDVDLTVVGDAGALVTALAGDLGGRVLAHQRFGTARVTWDSLSLDLAMARAESYPRPGALPIVRPGDLRDDVLRRDFTINALAIRLDGPRWGQLIDLTGGVDDLHRGLVRALHSRSFQDDPTRMFRAVRYEQRLGFRLEPGTEALVRRDAGYVTTVSADRLRREVMLILEEDRPELALLRLQEVGVLGALHPALRMSPASAASCAAARDCLAPERPGSALYLCLLTYEASPDERASLVIRLNLPGDLARPLRDLGRLQERLPALAVPEAAPSALVSLLDSHAEAALVAVALRTDVATVRRGIHRYLREWRQVRPLLSGHDLQALGAPRGPVLGTLLARLRAARLDGRATTREDEVRLVQEWLPALAGPDAW